MRVNVSDKLRWKLRVVLLGHLVGVKHLAPKFSPMHLSSPKAVESNGFGWTGVVSQSCSQTSSLVWEKHVEPFQLLGAVSVQHLLSRNGCFVLALRHLNLEHFNDILGHSIEWWALPRARGREAQWLFSGFWFNDSLHTFNAASIRWLISSSYSSFEPGRKLGPLRSTIIQLCPSWGRTTCCVVWS